MTESLTDTQKYDYIKNKYGKNADKILKQFGALAYEIDKAFPSEAQKTGGDKKYLQDRWESQLRTGKYPSAYARELLKDNESFKGKTPHEQYNVFRDSANTYKKYANEQAKAAEETKKIAYIRQKYGEKADVMLKTYGTMAYDIDKNFDKFYNKKVFFGRNYWMNQTESQKRSAEGVHNKKLFIEGKLPVAEAARIVNCPAFFGSLNSTIESISSEIKQSATTYKEKHKPAPTPAPQKETVAKTVPEHQAEQEKNKEEKKRTTVKKEMQTQRKVAELKPNVLDEVVVTAKAPEKKPLAAIKLETKLDNIKLAEIKIKSPAEQKYDELVAKKVAKMPDDLMGKKGTEIGLTIGELMKLGVDPKGDFQTILKNMGEQDRSAAEALIPKEGFKDKDVVVSKELAIKAIALSQYREAQKNRGKARA